MSMSASNAGVRRALSLRFKAASVGGLCFIVPIEMRVPARQPSGHYLELWQRDRRIARFDTKTYGGGWHRLASRTPLVPVQRGLRPLF
jgi:hypothetical protein